MIRRRHRLPVIVDVPRLIGRGLELTVLLGVVAIVVLALTQVLNHFYRIPS